MSLRAVMKSRRGNPLETAGFKQRRRRCNGLICYHFRQPELFMNLVVTTPCGVGEKSAIFHWITTP
ncbi:MAG: hypothetical protein IJM09_02950 [Neisseriaceae bacterium]|nr:hypothetical protein [Neisseriaceae bacterium]